MSQLLRYLKNVDSYPTRRHFLAGLAAVGAGAFFPGSASSAQPQATPQRIDLHHHFVSPGLAKKASEVRRQGWETLRDYNVARTVEIMDKAGIATGIASLTTPGLWMGDEFRIERAQTIALAREMNEFAAKMMSDYKGRFGLFTVLPMPDIDATLKEIEYGLDTLHADGAGFLSSYGRQWLGDKQFDPIWQELNRRSAVVYTHPTDSACCHNIEAAWSGPGTIEWLTDTARTIHSLIVNGPNNAPSVATRYPNIKFIWSHAGGSLIGLVSRVVGNVSGEDLRDTPAPNSRLAQVRRFYYDTAGSANPVLIQGLKTLLGDTSHIVFGTDIPFGNGQAIVKGLQSCGLTAEELKGIDRENAVRILPKYRT